jgi:Leucine-rich repeat (LRR) protein
MGITAVTTVDAFGFELPFENPFANMRAESLILSGNSIPTLPATIFEGMTLLKTIDLSDNMIAVLPEGIFQSSRGVGLPLTSLILYKNRIETLSEGIFGGLFSLSHLRLYGNKIAALPERIFQGLSSLEQLDLEKNEIAALPERIFEGLPLRIIYLDSNKISSLPERTFQGILSFTADTGIVKHHLTLLSLGNNQITILPEAVFRGLSSLSDLVLKNNNIEVLAKGIFRGLSSLSQLSLNDNRIAELPWGIFEGLPSLVLLHLHNNPGLQCVPLTPQQRAKLLNYKGPETLCAPSTSGPAEGTTSTSPPSPVSLPGSSSVTDTQKSGVGVQLAPDQTIGVHGVKMAVALPTIKEAFNSEAQVIMCLVCHSSYTCKEAY